MANMEKLERVQFATTLPGPKPICLVGTRSLAGVANLAPFSSITHLGSYPLLIGMVTRPDVVERRAAWKQQQPTHDARRLIFIDETGWTGVRPSITKGGLGSGLQ